MCVQVAAQNTVKSKVKSLAIKTKIPKIIALFSTFRALLCCVLHLGSSFSVSKSLWYKKRTCFSLN